MTTIPATATTLDGSTITGVLTNEHAASSYGQLVFVDGDGQAIDAWQLTNIATTPAPTDAARTMGRRTSPRKAASSAANGRKGGRPPRDATMPHISVRIAYDVDHANAYTVTINDPDDPEGILTVTVWTDPDGKALYENGRQIEGRSQFDAGRNPSAAIRRYYARMDK